MPHQTPFYEIHINNRATMIERDNWLIPAHYGDPESEYQQCGEHVGVFDTCSLNTAGSIMSPWPVLRRSNVFVGKWI